MTAPAATAPDPLPPAIADLLPAAVDLAIQLGELPPRNRLMTHLKVGAPKAATVRDALARVDWPTVNQVMTHVPGANDDTRRIILRAVTGEPDTSGTPAPHLHAVPDPVDPDPGPTDPDSTDLDSTVADSTGATGAQDGAQVGTADPVAAGTEPARDATPNEHGPGAVATTQAGTDVTETRPAPAVEPVTGAAETTRRPVAWPVLLLALPAFVAIWSGWVSLGQLSGFGIVHPLPGIADTWTINTAITLPVGMETYAAYAIYVWLSGRAPHAARRFAKWSAIGSLLVGALGQVTYHLMAAAGWTSAPWPITAAVACLPVAVLGMGAALAHLLHANRTA